MAKRRSFWLGILGLVAATAAAATYWYLKTPRVNVILVTFDTTRADHTGVYGYGDGLTKPFDDLARRGVVFEHAYAPAPLTLPSHTTMLTGLYPPEHGLRVNGSGRLDSKIPSLPEILKEHGYDTGAFIAAAVLDAQYGLDRGFDTYDDDLSQTQSGNHLQEPRRDGQDVMDSALAWLQQRTSRTFFCWIHLYDAHGPYDSRPAVFGERFAEKPYDAGVAREVQQIDRLTTFLADHKLDANTLVVVAGDHGEGLDDHLEFEHGMLVYNTTLHVPFVFAGTQKCPPGTRVQEAVSLVDLTPTVLDVIGIPTPSQVGGRSLLSAMEGKPIDARPCYAEAETPYLYNRWSPLHSVILNRWKYIHTTRPELYDLKNDPGELNDLAGVEVDQCREMRNILAVMQEAFVPMAAQNLTLSEKDIANLQTLGYAATGSAVGEANQSHDEEHLPDIKDMLVFLGSFERAREITTEGKFEEAITMLREISDATDQFPAAGLLMGDCLYQAGHIDEAVTKYRSVLARRPDFLSARFSLGRIFASQDRLEEAVTEFSEYIRQNPNVATCHFELGKAMTRMGNFDAAIREYREALRLAPGLAVVNLNLGQLLGTLGRFNEAAACFELAIRSEPNGANGHGGLMMALAEMGRTSEAIQHGKKAVALEPTSFDFRFALGVLLTEQQHYPDGLAELREAQKLRPDDPRPSQEIQRIEALIEQPAR